MPEKCGILAEDRDESRFYLNVSDERLLLVLRLALTSARAPKTASQTADWPVRVRLPWLDTTVQPESVSDESSSDVNAAQYGSWVSSSMTHTVSSGHGPKFSHRSVTSSSGFGCFPPLPSS